MGFHLKSFYNTTLRPIHLLILWYFHLSLSFLYTRKRGGERVTTKREMRPQLIFWPDHRSRNGTSTRKKSLGTETLDRNKLANWVGAREIARTTPIRLGIKGRGPDTTVDQSPTEKTTVNNKLSGTILKSRKMTNSQPPAQPSSATMDGKNSSFLRKDWHERSFSRGENHQLFQNFCSTLPTA